MKTPLTSLAIVAALAVAALIPTAAEAKHGNGVPHFEGKVVRVDRANDRFRVNDLERGSHRVYVNSKTRFQRVTFAGLRRGMTVDVKVRKSGGRWIATAVER
jgi:hypothetical protein